MNDRQYHVHECGDCEKIFICEIGNDEPCPRCMREESQVLRDKLEAVQMQSDGFADAMNSLINTSRNLQGEIDNLRDTIEEVKETIKDHHCSKKGDDIKWKKPECLGCELEKELDTIISRKTEKGE